MPAGRPGFMAPEDPNVRLMEFLQQHRLAVQASVSPTGGAQAAVVGFAVTDRLELVFDTLASSRKAANLRQNPRLAVVIGGVDAGDQRTVQLEGVADEPTGTDLERLKEAYYRVYPDGPSRLSWPGLIYVRVTPTWVRFSDYTVDPPEIVEFTETQLATISADALLHRAYAAFNARNIDGVLALMVPDVVWPNGMEGGFVRGHQAVREYWTRQWTLVDPNVKPARIAAAGGRFSVEVHQVVRDLTGVVLTDRIVHHVYELRDGRIASMEIQD
jgi:ketosteroid isomerase-like protein/general stress protein 26